MVTFEYHNVERRILLHRNIRFGQMLDDIKLEFDLPASACLRLVNAAKDYRVTGLNAGNLWKFDDSEVPKYRVFVGGETSEGKYKLMKRKSNIHNHSKTKT
ncbi:unnamed protein product [Rotaria magnacalcarata]|uniref:Uncharacterized protein n=1 Tax=Rotaria magnacalcarata TaxID=392030 RepID=A0A820EYQ4_9BILA|nr:unnamed protein product [Rotaria magnacalcarata]